MRTFHGQVLADIVGWDQTNWSKALAFWQDHLPENLNGFRCLELGAKQGGLSLYCALQGAQQVVCTDLDNPQSHALPIHHKYGLSTIEYSAADACQLPFASHSFDLVCFKSVLGGVRKGAENDKKSLMISEVHRVLKPGGFLIFSENLQGSPLHMFLRKHLVSWSGGWEYLSLHDILGYMAPFEHFQYQRLGYTGLLGRNERQRQFLGRLDQHLAFLPEDWRYIVAGVAQK